MTEATPPPEAKEATPTKSKEELLGEIATLDANAMTKRILTSFISSMPENRGYTSLEMALVEGTKNIKAYCEGVIEVSEKLEDIDSEQAADIGNMKATLAKLDSPHLVEKAKALAVLAVFVMNARATQGDVRAQLATLPRDVRH